MPCHAMPPPMSPPIYSSSLGRNRTEVKLDLVLVPSASAAARELVVEFGTVPVKIPDRHVHRDVNLSRRRHHPGARGWIMVLPRLLLLLRAVPVVVVIVERVVLLAHVGLDMAEHVVDDVPLLSDRLDLLSVASDSRCSALPVLALLQLVVRQQRVVAIQVVVVLHADVVLVGQRALVGADVRLHVLEDVVHHVGVLLGVVRTSLEGAGGRADHALEEAEEGLHGVLLVGLSGRGVQCRRRRHLVCRRLRWSLGLACSCGGARM
mmetsp:Transcript_22880/g.64808  ORF Transcript_22880/g.64808 Transcript_22880/m.64808 type:complete len:264 (-) Transcript_22880:21-812(-)